MKVYAVCVSHRYGFGCIGIAKTPEEANEIIEDWHEINDDTNEDEFDISTIEIDLVKLAKE